MCTPFYREIGKTNTHKIVLAGYPSSKPLARCRSFQLKICSHLPSSTEVRSEKESWIDGLRAMFDEGEKR
jgi:hypothetical protein